MNGSTEGLNVIIERAESEEARGNPVAAVFAWCEVLAIAPQRSDLRMSYAALLLRLSHVDAATAQFERVALESSRNWRAQIGIALCAFKRGDYHKCMEASAEAIRNEAESPVARIYWARAAVALSEIELARAILAPLHNEAPNFCPEDANEYAVAVISTGDYARGESVLNAAIATSPNDDRLKVNLALVYERGNRLEQSMLWLAKVRVFDQAAALLSARLETRSNGPALGIKALDTVARKYQLDQEGQAQLDFERGRCLDQLGDYDQAFEAFSAANQCDRNQFLRFHPKRLHAGSDFPWLAKRLDIASSNQSIAINHEYQFGRSAPIFLVGFPRSGTTLLDQILDAHPYLSVAEEKPLIELSLQAYDRATADSPFEIRLARARQAYWEAAENLGLPLGSTQLVDKFPLNLIRVADIHALFPDAHWIFAGRHPADVILSCFMQRFGYTDATQGFWSISSIASIYDASMKTWEQQREDCGISCHEIRYEDLVAQPEMYARALVKFLGLDWDERVMQTHQHARSRWIGTPSYDQVVKPINDRAVGRWRHYQKYFDEVRPIVDHWAEKLGYAPAQ